MEREWVWGGEKGGNENRGGRGVGTDGRELWENIPFFVFLVFLSSFFSISSLLSPKSKSKPLPEKKKKNQHVNV